MATFLVGKRPINLNANFSEEGELFQLFVPKQLEGISLRRIDQHGDWEKVYEFGSKEGIPERISNRVINDEDDPYRALGKLQNFVSGVRRSRDYDAEWNDFTEIKDKWNACAYSGHLHRMFLRENPDDTAKKELKELVTDGTLPLPEETKEQELFDTINFIRSIECFYEEQSKKAELYTLKRLRFVANAKGETVEPPVNAPEYIIGATRYKQKGNNIAEYRATIGLDISEGIDAVQAAVSFVRRAAERTWKSKYSACHKPANVVGNHEWTTVTGNIKQGWLPYMPYVDGIVGLPRDVTENEELVPEWIVVLNARRGDTGPKTFSYLIQDYMNDLEKRGLEVASRNGSGEFNTFIWSMSDGDDFVQGKFVMLSPVIVKVRCEKDAVGSGYYTVDDLYATTPMYRIVETRIMEILKQQNDSMVPSKRSAYGVPVRGELNEWFAQVTVPTFRKLLERFATHGRRHIINALLNLVDRYRILSGLESRAPRCVLSPLTT